MKLSKRTVLEFVGEFVATFLLAIVLFTAPIFAGGISPFMVGFAVIAIWYMFSSFSKTHMNPALSLGEYIVVLIRQLASKKFVWQDLAKLPVIMITQFLAFLAAFPLVNWIRFQYAEYYSVQKEYGLSTDIVDQILASMPLTNTYLAEYSGLVFVMEFILAFLVIFTFLKISTSEKFKQYTGIVWGLMIFAAMIIGIQITGASFNPWRSLVPAIFVGGEALSQVGLYIIAPFAGAIVAALVYALFGWLEQPGRAKATKTVKKAVKKKGKK